MGKCLAFLRERRREGERQGGHEGDWACASLALSSLQIFDPLTPQDLKQIVRIQERGLAKLLGEQKIELIIDDGAASFIVERAYSRHFGARRLKRYDVCAEKFQPALV